MLIRSDSSPGPVIAAARKVVRRVMPDVPLPFATSMEDTVAESMATERIMAMLALFFGGLALLITGIGLYGTLAYATERRTGEIGIRLALGARPKNVIAMVCTENGAIAVIGCLVGIAGSIAASKTIASFLYGVSARDPLVFCTAALLLLCVAAAASLVPAVKASKIDPVAAIRYE
jgi:putative ABC transport system permease protein